MAHTSRGHRQSQRDRQSQRSNVDSVAELDVHVTAWAPRAEQTQLDHNPTSTQPLGAFRKIRRRLRAMRRPATLLARRGALRPGLTIATAADIFWLHNDPTLYHQLVHKRHWTPAQFRDWLAHALQTQLLP
jgi:hypothetical protein